MADEFQGSGNWWDSSRNRYETGISPSSSSLTNLANFGNSSMLFTQDTHKLHDSDSSTAAGGGGGGGGGDPNLHIMGLGLSTQAMDWNQAQALFRGGEKAAETSFRSMLQDNTNMNLNTNYQETGQATVAAAAAAAAQQWMRSEKLFPGESEFKQINRGGFSLDQHQTHQFSPPPQYSSGGESAVTCQGLATSFQMDTAGSLYGNSSTTLLQGLLLGGDPYSSNAHFGMNSGDLIPSWSNSKIPQFLRNNSPPKPTSTTHNHLHFSNNTPYWNASHDSPAAMKEVRPSFFPSQAFTEKSKNISEVRDSGTVVKKSGSDQSSAKRPRNETTPSPLPAFKVRKEKMGDRITALQQLVSPFGKTDTASVLSEAIEYIKFLHEQVSVLSTPYMKSGSAIQQQHHQHQQQSSCDQKSKESEGPKQDLRSRGLCLVPVSSTFPVTHETTVDFWTPTFGGTFR